MGERRRAFRHRETPQRAQPRRLRRRDRSAGSGRDAEQAHRARPLQARERGGRARRRRPGRGLHGRRRARRIPLPIRQRRGPRGGWRQSRSAGDRHAVRRQVCRRRSRRVGRAHSGVHRHGLPGRDMYPHPAGRLRGRCDHHGPAGMGGGPPRSGRGLLLPHQQQEPRGEAQCRRRRHSRRRAQSAREEHLRADRALAARRGRPPRRRIRLGSVRGRGQSPGP